MVTARITCCIEESGNPYGRSARRKPQQTPPGFYAATKYAGTYIGTVSREKGNSASMKRIRIEQIAVEQRCADMMRN